MPRLMVMQTELSTFTKILVNYEFIAGGHKQSSVSCDPTSILKCLFLCADGEFRLLDGDKIAALAALFISDQLRALPFDLSLGECPLNLPRGKRKLYTFKRLLLQVYI